MRLHKLCPLCQKPLELTSEFSLGSEIYQSFKCGHSFVKDKQETTDSQLILESLDGSKSARPYQTDGVEFLLGTGKYQSFGNLRGNCAILADQMRLGKTPQSLIALKNLIEQAKTQSKDFKCLVLCRSSNIYQWTREIRTWVDNLPNAVWIIQGTKNWIPEGFQVYVSSMDTFSRRGTCKSCTHQFHDEECKRKGCDCRMCLPASDAMSDLLLGFGFDLVIADEAHSFKNTDSLRSIALTAFLKNIERSEIQQRWTFSCPFNHPPDDSNPYKIFGLEYGVTQEEIKQAWKDKAFESHPDHGGDPDQFRKLKEAALILQDPEKRKRYQNFKSGGGISWEETVTISTDLSNGQSSTTKSAYCPLCKARVTQSAAIQLNVKRSCSVILLTGTPIKNSAEEYFVPLNLVAPERFPSITNFRRKWLMQDQNGKYSRIAPTAFDAFMKEIEPFVLRREKEDVYKDIPKLNRIFTPIEISDQRLKDAYNKVLDNIEREMELSNFSYFNSIGELQILRQICGLGKVQWASDYAETFLMDSDKQKLAIGVHHHSVRNAVRDNLKQFGVCKLDGTDSPQEKDRIAHKYFEKSQEQILLLGMMAAKEGLELVYIDTALVLEREWSSADEEQFEYRFYNPDQGYLKSRGLENKVTNIEYIVAKGTIDEFFYNLVEEKRQIFGETLSKNWDLSKDPTTFKQLMEQTVGSRL